jgi:flagellar basal-body rod protein FlgF
MDNTLYVGLSRQMSLNREMDVIANNIANADTAGFKVESMRLQVDPKTPAGSGAKSINFVYDVGLARDFSQGALRQTGGGLDLGLRGDGFFQVQTAGGTAYTRDGRFALNDQSQIVTAAGDPVMGDGGSAITLDPTKGPPLIGADGTVSQNGQPVGKIGVVRFASNAALQKSGGGYYQNSSNLAAQPAPDTKIEQGMVESSNVEPISQMARLMAVSRAYEQVANMMDQTGALSEQAIQRLGKVN